MRESLYRHTALVFRCQSTSPTKSLICALVVARAFVMRITKRTLNRIGLWAVRRQADQLKPWMGTQPLDVASRAITHARYARLSRTPTGICVPRARTKNTG